MGAYPAAARRSLRARGGTSRTSARRSTISRLGRLRPVSTKLRWREEISASIARVSWLIRRRSRHCLSKVPSELGGDSLIILAVLRMDSYLLLAWIAKSKLNEGKTCQIWQHRTCVRCAYLAKQNGFSEHSLREHDLNI